MEAAFTICLKAALHKNLQYYLEAVEGTTFFGTSGLRGVCEDFICLSFIYTSVEPIDRDPLAAALARKRTAKSLAAQVGFMRSARPWQPIAGSAGGIAALNEAGDEVLNKLKQKYGWKQPRLPSIWAQAKATGHVELYEYLYHGTSEWVHFNPRHLMRLGWGPTPTEGFLSIDHQESYWRRFSEVYGFHLLQLFLAEFTDCLDIDARVATVVAQLADHYARELRWPELVTHEELNLEGPSPQHRIFLRLLHELNHSRPDHSQG